MDRFPSSSPNVRPEEYQFAKEVFEYLGCREALTRKFILVCFYAIRVFDWKQGHYGSDNIASSGVDGVRIRIGDKLARLKVLLSKRDPCAEEPIEDTLGDIGNYGLIGLMCRWGWWPGVARETTSGVIETTPVKVSEK